MTAPSISLSEQMLRRRPVIGAPVAHGASDHLKRTIGTFQLTMFGVGATVGTGIFFVLSEAVPEAGPAVILSFLLAGLAAGLAAICYAEMASAVPVSGSTYSYAYTTLGELVAMGVAACLLLEYGVSTAARLRRLESIPQQAPREHLRNQSPASAYSSPVGRKSGHRQSPGDRPGAHVYGIADTRRVGVGEGQHRHGDHQTRRPRDVHRHRLHRILG